MTIVFEVNVQPLQGKQHTGEAKYGADFELRHCRLTPAMLSLPMKTPTFSNNHTHIIIIIIIIITTK